MIDEIRSFKQKKVNDLKDAQIKKNLSPTDKANWKLAVSHLKELDAAIKTGASSLADIVKVVKSKELIKELTIEIKKIQKQLEEEYEDPEFTFKKMNKYVNMVIKGINPSTIICGAPGVGKTYNVVQQLKDAHYEEGYNLRTLRGKCSPRMLYTTLYNYRNSGNIVLIDDADGIVGPNAPEDCINILKGALDSTTDNEGRLITYSIAGNLYDEEGHYVPKRFNYNGSVIIITNYQAASLDSSLKGRAFIQDIKFTKEQLLSIVKKIMPGIDPAHLSIKSKIKAYDYLADLANSDSDMEISIRTFGICAKIFETIGNDPDFTDEEARKMIKEQMKLQAWRNRRTKAGKY